MTRREFLRSVVFMTLGAIPFISGVFRISRNRIKDKTQNQEKISMEGVHSSYYKVVELPRLVKASFYKNPYF